MSIVPGIVVYVLVWWVVIFAVLPFWVKPVEEGDVGHAAGAPSNPRLLRKFLVTTAIAAVIWLAIDGVISSGLISFRGS